MQDLIEQATQPRGYSSRTNRAIRTSGWRCPFCGNWKDIRSVSCRRCVDEKRRSPVDPAVYTDAPAPYRKLSLTRGMYGLIDLSDYATANQFYWSPTKGRNTYYASAYIDGVTTRLHKFILKTDDPKMAVDHINGDGLDCRRSNLRLAEYWQNSANRKIYSKNTTGYIGVTFAKDRGLFAAQIKCKNQFYKVCVKTAIEAARIRDRLAIKLHGEFATLNFPREDYLNETFETADGTPKV